MRQQKESDPFPSLGRGHAGRYLAVILLACIGVGLSLTSFFAIRWQENQKIQETFGFDSGNRAAALERALESDLWLMRAVAGLFNVSASVERRQFRDFVKDFLSCHPGIQAIEWIPRVADSERDEYERAARLEGWPGFEITERAAQGRMVRTARRDEYFPVYFVEPYQGNEIAAGFDLASNPTRLEALRLACDRGEIAATAHITLLQEEAYQNGFLIYMPIYRKGLPADTVEARRENLQGFVLGVFRIGDILESALSSLHPEGIDILLSDDSAPESERFLYFHPSRLRNDETANPPSVTSGGFQFSRSIAVADRTWRVLCTPIPQYLSKQRGLQSWGILFAGFFATGLVTVFFAGAIGRAAHVERLVCERTAELAEAKAAVEAAYFEVEKRIDERTTELAQSNEQLQFEVAERMKSGAALEQSEREKAIILDSIEESLAYHDREMRIIWANRAAGESVGLSAGDLVGRHCYELWQDRSDPCPRCPVVKTLETGRPTAGEMTDREGRDWLIRGYVVRDGNGSIAGAVEVASDISEQKRAAQMMREREELLQSVLTASPIGIGLDRNGVLDWANPAMHRIAGYEEGFLFGKKPSLLYIDDEEYSRASCELDAGILQKGVGESRARWITKDKKAIRCNIHASPLNPSDPSKGVIYAVADVTERKVLEEQIRHLQKMEAIGTLAGGIAHDFNNILGIILGYAEMATFEVEKETPVWKSLRQVISASNRARELVRQILAFSRQSETERTPVSIAPLAKEALKLLRSSLPSTIELRQSIGASCGSVLADPVQIHQILMNLCTNAAHAMRGHAGVLDVSLEDVELGPESLDLHPDLHRGRYARLTVTDTGHGMDRAVMERIFEPYFTTKVVGEGTGLGLSVVHGIVKEMGGAVTVESAPGKGTSFRIFLPVIGNEAAGGMAPSEPLPMGNERILFVDDEEVLVSIGKKMLEHLGYKVTARTSSVEALEAFRAKPGEFDLVITDMTMPNLTGIELARELLSLRCGIPIILCTGFSELTTAEEVKAMGIRDLELKPLVLADMARTVRRVLDDGESVNG